MRAARRFSSRNLLPAHAVPSAHGERLESLLVVLLEALLVPRVGFGQESFGVEDAGLLPVVEIVLDVLQVHADDVLARRLAALLFSVDAA